jgi:glycosyltransferase involved in cell wall biosynthesis
MIKLCIVANQPKYALGGAERQAMFIAEALSKRGFDVHVITASTEEHTRTVNEANVTFHELKRRSGQVPDAVGTALRMWECYRLIAAVSADVYYQRSSGVMTGVAAAACRKVGRPLVFGSSSLWEATVNLDGVFFFDSPLEQIRLSGRIYRYGVSHSRVIIAQTEQIANLFRSRLPKSDVRHIPTPVLASPIQEKKYDHPYALSIARLDWVKRPQAVLKVARMLPEVTFMLAGYGPMETAIREESAKIHNMIFLGRQSPEDALRLIRQARVFLNTSVAEGFPNTLSESLSSETPYVSFYDPDEIICRYGLGAHVHSLEEAAAAIKKYVSDEEESKRVGARGRDYLLKFHNPDVIARQYETLFTELSKSHG